MERARVQEAIRAMGFEIPDAQGNFVWLPLGDQDRDVCRARRAAAGVVVRPFSGEGVRVTIGEPAANDRWLAVLRDFLRL